MIMAFIAFWSALLVHIGVSLYAGAKVFDYFFGIPVIYSIIIIAVVTAIYTILGGLRAVVVTDSIQAVVLLAGSIVLTFLGVKALGGEGIHLFTELKEVVKPDQLSMARSLRDANGNFNEYSWLTLMIGYHLLGIWYWCTDQTIVQKALGAKDMRNAQLGAVFAGWLKILPLFFMVFPGVVAYVLFKDKIGGESACCLQAPDRAEEAPAAKIYCKFSPLMGLALKISGQVGRSCPPYAASHSQKMA
jgi:SSS family solute:Na+ symporter